MGDILILKRIRIIVSALLMFIFFPLIFLSFIPIFVLRYLTSLFKRVLRPDLGNLLTARSCIFAIDDLWTHPNATIVQLTSFEGHLTLDALRSSFREGVLKGPKSESCIYPELLQYPSRWMGFHVWVPETKFDLDQHMKHYDGPVTVDGWTDSVMADIINELCHRRYTPGKSPWEMYVIPSCSGSSDTKDATSDNKVPESALVIRIHHCLADGFSLLKLMEAIGLVEKRRPKPSYPKRNFLSICLRAITFAFQVPFDIAKCQLIQDPIGPWLLPEEKMSKVNALSYTSKIPMTYIKQIRDSHKATISGVIITAFTGALRRIMKESGKGIPKTVQLITALPIPGNPNKMRNYFSGMGLAIPVGNEDPLDTLRVIERDMKLFRKSTLPVFNFFVTKALGSLCAVLIKKFCKHSGVSVLLSNFPGPTIDARFLGIPVHESTYMVGFNSGGIGVGGFGMTSNGYLRLGFALNEAILPNAQAYTKLFTEYVLLEFDALSLHADGV